jgi:hypothetical protein
LGVGEGLAGSLARVGLDKGVVDPVGLEPGEKKVAEFVRADRGGEAGGVGVPGEGSAHPAVGVGLLPARLEQVDGAFGPGDIDVKCEGLFERLGERDVPVFGAFALGDPDTTGVEVDVVDRKTGTSPPPWTGPKPALGSNPAPRSLQDRPVMLGAFEQPTILIRRAP